MTVKNNKRTVFGWAMYDWANSAYSTTTVGALMPAYFAAVVVGEDGGAKEAILLYRSTGVSKREPIL